MHSEEYVAAVVQYFTPQVRYIMTGCKTHVVVSLPPVLRRGGITLPRRRYFREFDIESREEMQ